MRAVPSTALSSPARTARSTSARCACTGCVAHGVVQVGVDHRPHPVLLLARAAHLERPLGLEVLAVLEHRRPHLVEAPCRSAREQVSTGGRRVEGPGIIIRIAPASSRAAPRGGRLAVAVGLVDRDDVGELEDAALDALQLVAGTGQGEQQEGVDHLGDRDLVLADADGLDDDDVVAGRLEHEHRLAGGPGHPAELAARRARAG